MGHSVHHIHDSSKPSALPGIPNRAGFGEGELVVDFTLSLALGKNRFKDASGLRPYIRLEI